MITWKIWVYCSNVDALDRKCSMDVAKMVDYYSILGVNRDCTEEELKAAYRNVAKQYHPDLNKSADAAEKFREITDAYEHIMAELGEEKNGSEYNVKRYGESKTNKRTTTESAKGYERFKESGENASRQHQPPPEPVYNKKETSRPAPANTEYIKNRIKVNTKPIIFVLSILLVASAFLLAFVYLGIINYPFSLNNSHPDSPQFAGITGSVTGRVTTSSNNIGCGGAYISVVNNSNPQEEYYHTNADAYGNYQIAGINATYSSVLKTGEDDTTPYGHGYIDGQRAYRIYAKCTNGEGYSQAFGIDAINGTAITNAVIIPTQSMNPSLLTNPYPFFSQYGGLTGSVTGRVAVANMGLGGADVYLVNSSNPREVYYHTTTDAYGDYTITGIYATYSSVLKTGEDDTTPYGHGYIDGQRAYRIYAKSTKGEGYSQAFGIDAINSDTTIASVLILTQPVNLQQSSNQYPYFRQYGGLTGSITGRVIAYATDPKNGPTAVSSADVYLVNSSNPREVYYHTTTDAYGNYNIVGIYATYSSVLKTGEDDTTPYGHGYIDGQQAYRIYVSKTPYGEGYSQAFGIDAIKGSTTTVSVALISQPT